MRTRSPDLSLRVADTLVSGRMVAVGVLAICFAGGLSLAWIPPEIVFALTAIGIIAFIGVRWPYAGLILYMIMEDP